MGVHYKSGQLFRIEHQQNKRGQRPIYFRPLNRFKRNKTLFQVTYFLLVFLFQPIALAADFTTNVIGIIDGDSIKVMRDGKPTQIRLFDIDCPEKGQAFGKRAEQATAEFVFRKEVKVVEHGTDSYGRLLADVQLEDGRLLNEELVKVGMCWWYRKYSDNFQLADYENEARKAKLGLWRDSEPIPPWLYRKLKRGEIPVPTTRPKLMAPPNIQPFLSADLPIIGNKNSNIYHRPDCRNYDDVAEHNQVLFATPEEAEKAGFRVAGNCPKQTEE